MNNKLIYLIKNFFLLVILIVFFNSKVLSIENKIILKVNIKLLQILISKLKQNI